MCCHRSQLGFVPDRMTPGFVNLPLQLTLLTCSHTLTGFTFPATK